MRRAWKVSDPWGWAWVLRDGRQRKIRVARPPSRLAGHGRAVSACGRCPTLRPRRTLNLGTLLIGRSCVVASNRRLAHEMAVQGRGRWEVTALALTAGRRPSRSPARAHSRRSVHRAAAARAFDDSAREAHERRSHSSRRSVGRRAHWEEPYVAACAQVPARAGTSARGARNVSEHREALSVAVPRVRASGDAAPAAGFRSARPSLRRS